MMFSSKNYQGTLYDYHFCNPILIELKKFFGYDILYVVTESIICASKDFLTIARNTNFY